MDYEALKKIITEVLDCEESEITPNTYFVEDLGADSLDLFQIISGIENELDMEINMEKLEKIDTVGQALELIKNTVEK